MKPPKHILPTIVIAQFFCTSLWFAGNGVLTSLIAELQVNESLGNITASVQFGFIIGTLLFALLTLTDRFSPSKVFLWSALMGALCNMALVWQTSGWAILLSRFSTGFFLAGIYPVGMKIASDYYDKGLGKSLGYLVGALVVGTALPHFLKWLTALFPWQYVIYSTSALAALGGLLMVVLVPDGPFRKPSQHLDLTACFSIFKKKDFRAAAFGYFGHMWELYTFWAFVPVLLGLYTEWHGITLFRISFWSFWIIAIGGLACVLGGYISQHKGAKRTAATALSLSGICCLVSPLVIIHAPLPAFITFLLFWGMVVITDSPLFSTLVAQSAPPSVKGTALTIVNCVGFSITIVSLQLIGVLQEYMPPHYLFMILGIGPALGLWGLFKK
ncbi:MFS transporter [Flagellimonas meridianipacifica]|uniref:Putative MFS family arabinose efflux permease n=1 Tax=Flagellimonas meridianipacifica TaxID=1080225 RepID=A0A2T0MER1_9FLAO|nr:MFS transporter [Allomuricauda pacifica]PRX56052.1 putative MFS family arabinose efflux permease [Allomuricauda pacifica]